MLVGAVVRRGAPSWWVALPPLDLAAAIPVRSTRGPAPGVDGCNPRVGVSCTGQAGRVAKTDDELLSLAADSHRHRDVAGGWLRPTVFGAMDGLVTNVSLIAGAGGGGLTPHQVILTGVAGLVAGASSMATGEFVSVRSQNDLACAEAAVEQTMLDTMPEAEEAELAQMFVGRGVALPLAREVAAQMSRDPRTALRVHAQEELGIDIDELPSPWVAAGASMLSFAVGAVLPLLTYFAGLTLLWPALVVAAVAAFVGGAVVARITDQRAVVGGARQLLLAAFAVGATYLVGHLVRGAA